MKAILFITPVILILSGCTLPKTCNSVCDYTKSDGYICLNDVSPYCKSGNVMLPKELRDRDSIVGF